MSFPAVEFKYVTEEHLREWSSSSLGTHSPQVEVNPSRFMYELCWSVVRGDMPRNKCKVALDSVEFAENYIKEDSASILVDTIAHMGQEITLPGERRTRLIELAKWVVDSGLAPLRILQERCEAEFLWEAEMIKIKASDLKGKEVRVNTRLLYQQTKFNLLREESEGYAKLVTLLCQQGSDGSIETVISTMKSLIGHFDLDPNRVLDIVLECYEMQPENSNFLELVPLFPRSHICHILGFKFQYYQRSDVNSCVPTSLYMLAAILIKANLVDLDSLYEHLSPQDEVAFEQHEEFSRKRVEEANKIGKINLAATGKDLMEEEKPGDVTIDLYAALDMEQEALLESSKEFLINQKLGLLNGFLLIDDWPHVYIMLERLAPLNPAAHMQICNGLFRALEKSIVPAHALVRPPYLAKLESSAHDDDTCRGGEPSAHVELQNEVFQMLACIGSYLYRDALLLQKVCRVLRGYYLSALALSSNQPGSRRIKDINQTEEKDHKLAIKEARMNIEEALGTCLLPALQMLPANPAIGLEIWGVMGLLPYEARYRLYGEWEKEDERLPMLLIARQIAKLDTRRILKRLAKDNLKQLGRMVAKIAHANPMTVLRTIVQQIEAYKDMITPVVDAFKYLTQLEYDVLEYVVIERLAYGGREKVKEDGLNVSDWLQSLASFWGHLCKKYPSMELRGLFQYLVNQLKKGQGTELVVLQELIQQMANIEYTENMTDEQLEALAGGETLRFQATSFGVSRNNKVLARAISYNRLMGEYYTGKAGLASPLIYERWVWIGSIDSHASSALLKSTNRLKDALIPKDEPKLVVPLLLLIAQHRSSIIINADAPYIKIVSEQFDRCHGTLLQYVEFLISAISPATSYAELIPSLDDLIHKYHLEPEVSFLIYRPVMRLLKSFRGSNGALPMDTSKDVLQTDGCKESGLPIVVNNLVLDLGSGKVTTTWPDFVKTVHMVLPPKAWNSLSPELYATFWGLTLHDLYVPRKRYETEIAKQHAALKAQEESADNSHAGVTKRKKDKEKIQEIIDRLQSEMQKQEENVTAVHQRLAKEKDTWLTSCPDSLKINMEFLQRCIFPRCVFSMLDAIYCARFVHMMHSLGTPFFNTVNHIDVLICKTLQPLIHCCTEYEAGRLGRFLYETLKMAYYWKSDEAIYERECGNMPGFAVLYRDPNSARVTFGQFVKVHWKWSTRITKLLIQCLESSEYMEIRNALTVLFKISSVFPVTRKSGVNLEKRVSKIKGDEREDLKVLAIGVSAALAVRKSAWVSDEEFTVGYVDFNKCATTSAKTAPARSLPPPENVGLDTTAKTTTSIQAQSEVATACVGKATLNSSIPVSAVDTGPGKVAKLEQTHAPSKSVAPTTVKDIQATQAQAAQTESTKLASTSSSRKVEEDSSQVLTASLKDDDGNTKPTVNPAEPEGRSVHRRAGQGGASEVLTMKPAKEVKDESRIVMSRGATSTSSGPGEKESATRGNEIPRTRAASIGIQSVVTNGSASTLGGPVKSTIGEKKGSLEAALKSHAASEQAMERNGLNKSSEPKITNERDLLKTEQSEASDRHSLSLKSPARDDTEINNKPSEPTKEKTQKRSIVSEDTDKINKRRRGGPNERSVEAGEVRMSEREKSADPRVSDRSRSVEQERGSHEERIFEKSVDRGRDRAAGERVDREYRTAEKAVDRYERLHAEDHTSERSIDRSMERYGKEKSVDRVSERTSLDRPSDRVREERGKEERSKSRYNDSVGDQSHGEDRFSMHGLPPPPPLPPNVVPQSLHTSRREEEEHRKTVKTASRMSPRREDKSEKRRSDEGSITSVDESKRRREEDGRDRKREDREILSIKAEKEREKDKDKSSLLKEDESSSALSKRRRLKRDHLSSSELGSNFGPSPPPPPLLPLPPGATPQQYDTRDRDRKASSVVPRGVYAEDSPYEKGQATGSRIHSKETSKASRRDHDPVFDRDWEEDKPQRGGADIKRRHHRK